MTQFWLVAAGMILLALGFIIFPLFRNRQHISVDRNALNISVIRQQLDELEADLSNGKLEQSAYEAAKTDLEKALLRDVEENHSQPAISDHSSRWLSIALAIILPAVAFLLYEKLGTPAAIVSTGSVAANVSSPSPSQSASSAPMMSMEEAVAKLEQRLEQEPDNAEGWDMLARTHMSMEKFDRAVAAYEKLHALIGDQPEVLVRYADALAMIQNGKIAGKPFELIKTALKTEPANAQANWMAGLAEEELGNYPAALEHWQAIRPLLTAQPELLQTLDNLIARVETQITGVSPTAERTAEPKTAPQALAKEITVSVELAPEMVAMTAPDETVFIFAQAMQGPPMPLAVSRHQVKDLPVTVTLDDTMAMMPQMKLSAYSEVKIGARISKSGQAMPESGDLLGSLGNIKPGQENTVNIQINQKIP